MKINVALRRLNSMAVAMGLVSILGVGCSGSQQEEEKLEATDEPAVEEAVEAVEEPAEEEASMIPEPLPVATPAPSSQASATDNSRVVRYVSQDEVMIHSQPNDKTEPVGKLKKGDMILIVESEGWGRISDNMFIKANALSNKAVPRNRNPAVWGKPTH